ncbi:hypothetical protein [Roseovarius sp. 2305UL8-3]|uniref:hypothetical protein n=1 Tax=Roseovarius conchicola TaxID=3121636 RepID=UPI003527C203
MTRRAISVLAIIGLTGAGLTTYALTRPDPAPVFDDGLGEPIDCTTCDARQKAKKRLSDHLRSKNAE